MNDFETLLAERLNDLVDYETGPERPAPEFVPTSDDDDSSARGWLLAAAVVIIAVGLSWAGISWATRPHTPAVASPSSAVPSTSTPTPTVSSGPSASPTPSTTRAPSSGSPSSTAALTGGARIVVPAGWKLTVYAAGTGGAENRRWWCINPDASATPQPPLTTYATDACVISLIDLGKVLAFDPNGRAGVAAEASCNDIHGAGETGVISDTVDLADTRTFGGSPSQFSAWTHVCEGYTLHGEQYQLPTSPNWDLFTNFADTTYAGVTVSSVMASIAGSSTLPARTSTLWMGDRGYVRSLTQTSTGMTIVIDRYQECAVDQYVIRNDDTATTTYVVPRGAAVTGADKLTPGAKVSITTDGRTVTAVDYLGF